MDVLTIYQKRKTYKAGSVATSCVLDGAMEGSIKYLLMPLWIRLGYHESGEFRRWMLLGVNLSRPESGRGSPYLYIHMDIHNPGRWQCYLPSITTDIRACQFENGTTENGTKRVNGRYTFNCPMSIAKNESNPPLPLYTNFYPCVTRIATFISLVV